tara:strand:+ start:592 stop:1326 length:735 start_codon:yes stop_codon:yes gene_type:complete
MVELIMAEFGEDRKNAGGSTFSEDRLNPSLDSFREYFPNCKVTLYCDFDYKSDDIEVIKVNPSKIFDKSHRRYGWRAQDYYKVYGLSKSKADVAISLDADMKIVSREVTSIIEMVGKFDICLPMNPRMLTKIDGILGIDSNYKIQEDGTLGLGMGVNMSPIAVNPNKERTQKLLKAYCNIMETNPARGPLSMWRAIWETGITPYMLPFQWCVCKESMGIGNEIMLHVGHPEVEKLYVEQWGIKG